MRDLCCQGCHAPAIDWTPVRVVYRCGTVLTRAGEVMPSRECTHRTCEVVRERG